MGRKAKPFVHHKHYYTTRRGKWMKLCPVEAGEAEAARILAAIISSEATPVAKATPIPVTPSTVAPVLLSDAVAVYLKHCLTYYKLPTGRVSSEPRSIELAFSYLLRATPGLPATALLKEHVKTARELMKPTCSRKTCNKHIGRIKRGVRWMSEANLIPETAAGSVVLLSNLPAFRSGVKEYEPITAVNLPDVRTVVEEIVEPWRSLILLQWWSGLRPGEACRLKVEHLCEGDDECFVADFGLDHKGGWRGKRKVVRFGPQASAVIRPWVYAAMVERQPNVFTTRKRLRGSLPQPATPGVYARAVLRACRRAGVLPWSPNQLRHSYATRVRAAMGLEAAQQALGHARADVTEIYGERDARLAQKVAKLMG